MNEVSLDLFKESLRNVEKFINDLPRRMEQMNMEIKYYQDEVCDIQHKLELEAFNASNGYKRAYEIAVAQRKRRIAKDELEYLRSLDKRVKGVFKQPNAINQLVQSIDKVEEEIATRTYTPKVRKDLFEEVKHFDKVPIIEK